MKGLIVVALVVAGSTTFAQVDRQDVGFASTVNFYAAEVNASSDVVDFLVTANGAHLMNIEEGTLASRNAQSQKIKEYARKMMNDQRKMLGYIKKLAVLRDINLPGRISDENRDGCDKLAGLSGKKFDKKFVKMMINERKRDLDLFKQAASSSDPEVREFAQLYIPVLENHLKNAKELKSLI
jgi:putative membrane protein